MTFQTLSPVGLQCVLAQQLSLADQQGVEACALIAQKLKEGGPALLRHMSNQSSPYSLIETRRIRSDALDLAGLPLVRKLLISFANPIVSRDQAVIAIACLSEEADRGAFNKVSRVVYGRLEHTSATRGWRFQEGPVPAVTRKDVYHPMRTSGLAPASLAINRTTQDFLSQEASSSTNPAVSSSGCSTLSDETAVTEASERSLIVAPNDDGLTVPARPSRTLSTAPIPLYSLGERDGPSRMLQKELYESSYFHRREIQQQESAAEHHHAAPFIYGYGLSRRGNNLTVMERVLPMLGYLRLLLQAMANRNRPGDETIYIAEVLRIFRSAFVHLARMHAEFQIHGDVKLANLGIALDQERLPDGLFLDFGSSRELEEPGKKIGISNYPKEFFTAESGRRACHYPEEVREAVHPMLRLSRSSDVHGLFLALLNALTLLLEPSSDSMPSYDFGGASGMLGSSQAGSPLRRCYGELEILLRQIQGPLIQRPSAETVVAELERVGRQFREEAVLYTEPLQIALPLTHAALPPVRANWGHAGVIKALFGISGTVSRLPLVDQVDAMAQAVCVTLTAEAAANRAGTKAADDKAKGLRKEVKGYFSIATGTGGDRMQRVGPNVIFAVLLHHPEYFAKLPEELQMACAEFFPILVRSNPKALFSAKESVVQREQSMLASVLADHPHILDEAEPSWCSQHNALIREACLANPRVLWHVPQADQTVVDFRLWEIDLKALEVLSDGHSRQVPEAKWLSYFAQYPEALLNRSSQLKSRFIAQVLSIVARDVQKISQLEAEDVAALHAHIQGCLERESRIPRSKSEVVLTRLPELIAQWSSMSPLVEAKGMEWDRLLLRFLPQHPDWLELLSMTDWVSRQSLSAVEEQLLPLRILMQAVPVAFEELLTVGGSRNGSPSSRRPFDSSQLLLLKQPEAGCILQRCPEMLRIWPKDVLIAQKQIVNRILCETPERFFADFGARDDAAELQLYFVADTSVARALDPIADRHQVREEVRRQLERTLREAFFARS
ncbi:MAG: hypothetical protein ACOYKZ_05580 [Chlamydiia bacterium]